MPSGPKRPSRHPQNEPGALPRRRCRTSASRHEQKSGRALWERISFIQAETIDPLPGWRPNLIGATERTDLRGDRRAASPLNGRAERRIRVRLLRDQSTALTGRKRIRSRPRAIDTSAPVFSSSDTAERFAAGKADC